MKQVYFAIYPPNLIIMNKRLHIKDYELHN